MDARNPDTVLTGDSDEISLSDLVRSIWSSRAFAVGGLLLGGGIAASATLLNYWMTPQSETYRQQIALNVDGTYPNGTAFSVNDLRSPAVLQRVFTEKGLDEYGIGYADFAAEVAITPSSSVYDSVVERYRARLNDQSLSYAERQQIETEFSSALGASLASGATIAVTIPGEFGVPRNVGRSVPVAIANTWADIYIHQLGVLDFPVPNTSSELISAEFVAGLDYPIAYDALVEAFDTLEERLDLIGALAGSNNLTEPETGRTLYDIGREVFNLRNFSLQHVLAPLTELGVNRSPELTIAAYAYQLQELDREIQLAERNAGLIDAVLSTEGDGPTPLEMTGIADPAFAGSQPTATGSVVQQFGPELVDRLIGMSVENAGVAFREQLLARKLEHEQLAVERTIERDRLASRLALMRNDTPAGDVETLQVMFDEESARIVEALNTYWRQADAILTRANVERLGYDKQLFTLLPTAQSVEESARLFSRSSIVTWSLAGLLGAFAGVLVYFAGRAVRRQSS